MTAGSDLRADLADLHPTCTCPKQWNGRDLDPGCPVHGTEAMAARRAKHMGKAE